ncbi:WecB/TagA/CpsF family glycosyltransferase [Chromatiaceae bacterium AAb-1]|nr:WecB/TagA/CpsF family glycosyltransferase [Chromatiaceae bacterium AAb-1]
MQKSREVAGIRFCLLDKQQVVQSVMNKTPASEPLRLVVTTNVDHMVTMSRNAEFKAACQQAWLVTADGFPVVRLLRLLGIPSPGRITGADLFPQIMNRLTPDRYSPFFVCSSNATAAFLQHWLQLRGFSAPELRVVVPPFGFEHDLKRSAALIEQINTLKTTHLFFGVGAPKSELWMSRHSEQLQGMYGFGFGAGLDFFSGTARRAPAWMQKTGLEWLWRLLSDPRRLARRYLIDSWIFLRIAIQEYRYTRREGI